ncbi:MAG: DMT family transporter [Bacteroidales bacterium]|nr:DMT family transporter [Bacteroidales bacterium]
MKNIFQSKVVVYAISVISIALWGMSYLWSNQLVKQEIPVEYIVCVRSLIAGAFLYLMNLLFKQNIHINKKDMGKFVGLALCEPTIYFVLETYGIKLTESPTYSALVVSTSPIFSGIAGIMFFKEKLTKINILGIFVCLAGLALVVTNGDKSTGEYFILGIILLFLSVIIEVGYAIFTKQLSSGYSPSVIVMYQFLIGGVFLTPLAYMRGAANFDAELYMSWSVWKPLLCLALLCSSVAFTMWAATIKNLGVAKASVFLAMIPVFTAILGVITGTEVLTIIQWTGIAVAFCGLILTQYVKKDGRI